MSQEQEEFGEGVLNRSRLSEYQIQVVRDRLIQLHFDKHVGHLGGNLSSIDVISLLLSEFCDHPRQLVLSKGHSALALYVALWFTGWISESDLDSALNDGTRLPGHPPFNDLDNSGIAFGTGSLGHGLSLATGMALARKLTGDSRRTFCIVSDGELQEGQTLEAFAFAARLGLGGLVVVVDGNGLQGFGTTDEVERGRDIERLLKTFDIELKRENGHDLESMRAALFPHASERPLILWLNTVKGNGIADIEGKLSSHYLPLTPEQFNRTFGRVR